MPIFDESDESRAGGATQMMRAPTGAPQPAEPPPPPGWGDIFGAAWRDSPLYSVGSALGERPEYAPEPGYDPVPGIMGTRYEGFADRFLGDVSPLQTERTKAAIDQELHDSDTWDRSGIAGKAAIFAGGFIDPALALLPEARAAEAGIGLGTRFLRAGAAGAAYATAYEGEMALSHPESMGQAAEHIASNTLLMGVLGGAIGHLTAPETARAVKGLDETRADIRANIAPAVDATGKPVELPPIPPTVQPSKPALAADLSAAESDKRTMELSRIGLPTGVQEAMRKVPGGGAAIDATTAAFMHMSPTLRIFSSDSIEARRAAGDLAETGLRFTQAEEGVPSAQGGISLWRLNRMQQTAFKMETNQALTDEFLKYRGETSRARTELSDFTGRKPEDKLSWSQFKERVTLAGYNGYTDAIPEVAVAATRLRDRTLNPVGDWLETIKDREGNPLLSANRGPPAGDPSWFPRRWNPLALASRYNDALHTFSDWLTTEQLRKQGIRERLRGLRANRDLLPPDVASTRYRSLQSEIEEQIKGWGGKTTDEALAALKKRAVREEGRAEGGPSLKEADHAVDLAVDRILANESIDRSPQDISSLAAEIIDRIRSSPDGRLPYDAPSGGIRIGPPGKGNELRGSLNARDFAIPSAMVKDFLELDAERVMAAHLRTVIPDGHLVERFGDVDMTENFRKINEDYTRLREGKNESQLRAIDRQQQAVIRDVAALRDRIRGTYGWSRGADHPQLARVANAVRNWNFLTDLNSSVINRFIDPINALARHSLLDVFGDAYLPMIKAWSQIDKTQWKAAKQSMHDLGVGVDTALGHIQHQYDDVFDDYLPGNKFERGLREAVNQSMRINLHGPWTDHWKTVGGVVAQAELLRTAGRVAGGTATKKDIANLANAGIELPMAERIWNQFSKEGGGQTFGKATHIPNTGSWADSGARQAFSASVARDADMSVLQPGLEKPLWLSDPILSLAGQYRSFIAAAYEKIFIANLQRMDAITLQHTLAALSMGTLSYAAYSWIAGRPLSDNPADWVKEAVSRSALFAWLSEAASMAGKLSGGAADPWRLAGAGRPLSRTADIDALGELLGPTASKVQGIAKAASHGLISDKYGRTAWTARDTHNMRVLLPLQNHFLWRRPLDAVEDNFNSAIGIRPMNRTPSWAGPGSLQ
jgi:hypothetical protein